MRTGPVHGLLRSPGTLPSATWEAVARALCFLPPLPVRWMKHTHVPGVFEDQQGEAWRDTFIIMALDT